MGRTKTAENAILYYEAGQDFEGMKALSDSGDHTTFTSGDSYISDEAGKAPAVRPDGLATGGAITPAASGTNNLVDVALLSCYLAGVLTSVGTATDEAITRPSGDSILAGDANYIINSVTVTSAGAIAVVAGTEGASFSTTRGADGGPPFIPVGSIEIGQVKLSSDTDAAILITEIYQDAGSSQERYDYPSHDIEYENGEVIFNVALQAIHEGSVPRGVYAEWYTATFAKVPKAYDWVPPKNTHSVDSEQTYDGTSATVSSTLGQGSFSAQLNDGVSDGILNREDKITWFRFFPDRYVTSKYQVAQGMVGISYTYPPGGAMVADVTVSASEKATNIAT